MADITQKLPKQSMEQLAKEFEDLRNLEQAERIKEAFRKSQIPSNKITNEWEHRLNKSAPNTDLERQLRLPTMKEHLEQEKLAKEAQSRAAARRLQDEELLKLPTKGLVRGTGIMALLAAAAPETIAESSDKPNPKDYGSGVITNEEKQNHFANIIKQLESSGGKNLEHKTMKSGIQKGDTAGGAYGIMPNTLKDIVNQSKNINPEIKNLSKQPSDVITNQLNENPEIDEKSKELISKYLMDKTKNDEIKAAYGWNMGHNQDLNNLEPEKLINSPYVQKYIDKIKEEDPDKNIIDPEKFNRIKNLMGSK